MHNIPQIVSRDVIFRQDAFIVGLRMIVSISKLRRSMIRYYLVIGIILLQTGCPQYGCRRILCTDGPSNLWPRYVQRQADHRLSEQGFCPNPTHRTKVTSDYEMGFTSGYYQTAMCRIQPYPEKGEMPIPYPTTTWRRIANNDGNPVFHQGFSDGVVTASSTTIGGFAPGQGPLLPVPLTLPKRARTRRLLGGSSRGFF